MRCEYFKDGEFIDGCDQTNIPRVDDGVIIDYTQYRVLAVVWNYDIREIRIELAGTD